MSSGFDETADAGTGNAGAPVTLRAGSFLGKYRLDRVLGEGGMGVVWAAHDPDLERAIAIKVLRYAQAGQQLRQRLLREARAMARLKHPNVLTVYEVGTVGDRDYIAMELVDGMTLDAWLALGPTEEERWSAVLAAGRGLAAAHDAGVVHRDFKPHNVLRSREGRVLVTDFGLARGMLGEEESAAIDASAVGLRATDALLDSPLTQTGALVGTPAYMAPEQHRGAPPDPRTDQFAFCVTAWQALTGERPFKGQTLEEMRDAASAGVAHIAAKLPRDVRAVLARGLDPDPAQRWPSLEVLLDELERAGQQPARRKRRVVTAAVAVSALALIAGAAVIRRPGERARTGCDEPDQQFAEAWSPAVMSELAKRTSAANVARISEQLQAYSERWIDSYAKACRVRPERVARQRVACLEGIRDRASAITTMLREVEPSVLDDIEPRDALPHVASCERPSALGPPLVPKAQPLREKILGLIGQAYALRGTSGDQLAGQIDKQIDALLAEAAAVGWPPLASIVLVAGGTRYLRTGEPAQARETFVRALAALPKEAALRDVQVEGAAYVGLLEASLVELEHPEGNTPASLRDTRVKPVLHEELAAWITKATSAASDDPMLLATRSLLAARAYAQLAQWNRYRSAYNDALRYAGEARKLFDELGDVRRSAMASAEEASIYLLRGDGRALDDALFAARRAQDALAAAALPTLPALEDVRATVAFARRDWRELHRILDARERRPRLPERIVHGRVLGAHGSVHVVAWRGELIGNPARAYTDPGDTVADHVRTDETGAFTIHAEPDWVITAEAPGQRATPRPVGTGDVTLRLEPTVTISGEVQGKGYFGVRAFASYTAAGSRWTLQTPIEKDGAFDLRGLPPGARVYGTQGPAGTGTRTVIAGASARDISWPYGEALDVIVRAQQFDAGGRAWVIRGKHAPRSRAEVEALAATARDVATSPLLRIGANNTDAGRAVYRHGDRHAVITGNVDDDYTICAAAIATGPVACRTIAVTQTVVLEYADGGAAGGTTPVLLEL